MRKITHIVVHHSASPLSTKVESVNQFHKTKNWGTKAKPEYASPSKTGYYVTYHKFIEQDGKVTTTHLDDESPWHASSYNPFSLGVCLAGWFDEGHDAQPTIAQEEALKQVLKEWVAKYQIPKQNIIPHRKVPNTIKSCYGLNLADDWASILAYPMPENHPEVIKVGADIYFLAKQGKYQGQYISYGDGDIMLALYGNYRNKEIVTLETLPKNMSTLKLKI